MVRIHASACSALCLTVVACGRDNAEVETIPEALAMPELLAPGVISTDAPEFAVSFSPDGRTVYFNRASPDRAQLTIMYAMRNDTAWSIPVPAPFSGENLDVDAFVTPDGTRVFFSSDRPTSPTDTAANFNTWYVDVTPSGWGDPALLAEPFNSDATEVFVSVAEGDAVYFWSNRDGEGRIYRGLLGYPEEGVEIVSFDVNEEGVAGNPLVAPDESFLIFTAEREDGIGGSDLYVTRRVDERWMPAELLGSQVNSEYADFAPALSPDGRYLLFTSERPGIAPGVPPGVRPPGDIYRIPTEPLDLHP